MTTNPIIGVTGATGATAAQTPTPAAPKPSKNVADALTGTDTFLTLLVAQLKNQDPLQPADSTAFVTQLATFSGVEQSTQMRDDLDAIKAALTNAAAATTASSTTAPTASSATAASAGASSTPSTTKTTNS